VQGLVCQDVNRNSRCDPDEAGLTGVTVWLDPVTGLRLRGGRTTSTDADGRFRFADVQPARHNLGIQQPAGSWATTPVTVELSPALRQTVEAAFGLYWPSGHLYLPLVGR
jgi:hypothetical protein